MKGRKGLLLVLSLLVLCFSIAACAMKPLDGAQGTYDFVQENMSIISNTTYDYQFILDGHGVGEYIHKGSNHKVKYEYDSATHSINIKDTMTGIKYNGTLSESGELHIYDGNPNGTLVSEFFYQRR